MKIPTFMALALSSYLLSACVKPTLVIGQPHAGINSEDVVVYFIDRPRCNFETIAHIQVSGGYYSLSSMLANMRKKAAGVGASGLFVLHTQQLGIKEYLGTAKAIRCLPA